MTDNLARYALRNLSSTALTKANELNLSPSSYNYKSLSDTRREGGYLYLLVEGTEVLYSRPFKSLEQIEETYPDLGIEVIE